MSKSQADAPNYREATGDQRCGTCMHFTSGQCSLYNFAADPSYVCDSWAVRGTMSRELGMGREYKAAPTFMMGIDGQTVTGIVAVHGNIDEGNDRSYPGLFGDFTAGGRNRTRFLWQHDSSLPPVANIDRAFEVNRADLPGAVLKYAPDATGGTAVTRTYLSDDVTTMPGWVCSAVKSGALTEMSYAYDVKDARPVEIDGRLIRDLYRVDVYDFSDVNWGMNPATSADGSKGRPLQIEHATVLAAVKAYTDRYQQLSELRAKEGRVLSGENRKRIEAAIEALDAAAKTLGDLLVATEPQKTGWAETHQLRGRWLEQQQRLRELGVPL